MFVFVLRSDLFRFVPEVCGEFLFDVLVVFGVVVNAASLVVVLVLLVVVEALGVVRFVCFVLVVMVEVGLK